MRVWPCEAEERYDDAAALRDRVAALEPPPAPAEPRVACDSDVRTPSHLNLAGTRLVYVQLAHIPATRWHTAGTHGAH